MTTDNNTQIQTAEEILSAFNTPPETPQEAPQGEGDSPRLIGGVDESAFQAALKEATGGKISDVSSLTSVFDSLSRLGEYEKKVQEMEARQKVSPFASPLSEKINNVFATGGDINTVQRLIQLSAIDPDSMGYGDAIRMQFQMQNPGYSQDEIEVLIENKLGFSLSEYSEEDADSKQKVALKTLGKEAQKFLAQERVSAENPIAVEQANKRNEEVARTVGVWKDVLPQMAEKMTVDFAFNDEPNGINLALNYAADPEDRKAAMEATMAAIQQYPDQFPPNQSSIPQIQDLYKRFLVMTSWEKLTNTLWRDAYAKAQEEVAKKVAGPPPQRPNTHISPQQTSQQHRRPPAGSAGFL